MWIHLAIFWNSYIWEQGKKIWKPLRYLNISGATWQQIAKSMYDKLSSAACGSLIGTSIFLFLNLSIETSRNACYKSCQWQTNDYCVNDILRDLMSYCHFKVD